MRSEISSLQDVQIFEREILGHGYISVVKKGRHKTTGKEYACKIVLSKDRPNNNQKRRNKNLKT